MNTNHFTDALIDPSSPAWQPLETFLTLQAAAERVGVSRQALYVRIKAGTLPAHRLVTNNGATVAWLVNEEDLKKISFRGRKPLHPDK